jgi:hypothetical protein
MARAGLKYILNNLYPPSSCADIFNSFQPADKIISLSLQG